MTEREAPISRSFIPVAMMSCFQKERSVADHLVSCCSHSQYLAPFVSKGLAAMTEHLRKLSSFILPFLARHNQAI